MNTTLISLMDKGHEIKPINGTLSLKPFIKYLEEQIHSGTGVRSEQLQHILDRIRSFGHLDMDVTIDKLQDYKDVFELVYTTLVPPATNENEYYWGMGFPFTATLFYETNALLNFIKKKKSNIESSLKKEKPLQENLQKRLNNIYAITLEKLYGISLKSEFDMIHHIKDEDSGLNKYFRVEVDSRFIDVKYKGKLPDLYRQGHNPAEAATNEERLDYLQRLLPLENLDFSGFSIIHITDITAHQVIENIKDVIVNLGPEQKVYNEVSHYLKEIMGSKHVDARLIPVLKVNNKFVSNFFDEFNDNLNDSCCALGLQFDDYIEYIESYIGEPKFILVKDSGTVQEGPLMTMLQKSGIQSLAIIPVFFQKELVGILIITADKEGVLDENILSSILPTKPLLEQLLQTTIDDYKIKLDNIVKDKFTLLQPAIEWKFNEIAFDYLQRKKADNRAEIKEVNFPSVYPLYGAIDVRNSTIERNNALRNDIQCRLGLLKNVLEKLAVKNEMGIINELIYKTDKWTEHIADFITSDDEYKINLFFDEDVDPFLSYFKQHYPEFNTVIETFFHDNEPQGIVFKNRRELEAAFHIINRSIATQLEYMNNELQRVYPFYFEKFRSDGIEYDIYIGQSITPNRPFHALYLKNIRLWQLSSMALIAKQTRALQSQMPKQLETTQLIFVHNSPIDISFRNDERRFDVEGAYNIRYEMVKKRIDKVLIKDTGERLTQPGKIALVYFQPRDIEEYISHIHYLQSIHILSNDIMEDDIEYLELEELQGVSGLKALRVSVAYNDDSDWEITPEGKLNHSVNK